MGLALLAAAARADNGAAPDDAPAGWSAELPTARRRFLPSPGARGVPPDVIPRDDALDEIEWIDALLTNAYAGWELEGAGAEAERRLRRLRTTLALLPRVRAVDYFEQLWSAMGTALDRHFVLTARFPSGERSHFTPPSKMWIARNALLPRRTCAGFTLTSVPLHTGQGRTEPAVVAFGNRPPSDQCVSRRDVGGPTAGLWQAVPPPAPTTATTPFTIERRASLVYVRLPSLSRFDVVSALGASAAQIHPDDEVVLDLRGNTGGDEFAFRRWLEAIGAPPVKYDGAMELRGSAVTQIQIGWIDERLKTAPPGSDAQRDLVLGRQSLRERLFDPQERDDRTLGPWTVPATRTPKPDRRHHGRFVLIVDRDCLSACEAVIAMTRQFPDTVVAGTNSGGSRIVAKNVEVTLPHSRFRLTFGTAFFPALAHDESFAEARGYTPDLWLPSPINMSEDRDAIIEAARVLRAARAPSP